MYIKCDTVEQLDEVRKYYNIEKIISSIDMLSQYNNTPVLLNPIGDWGGFCYINDTTNYTPYSDWKESKLRYQEGAEGIIKFRKENEMKDQFIQLEGGKLNITKAKTMGLFIEDKKVFTLNKCNGFSYKDYVVTCNEFNTVQILHENELILRLYRPTKYKVEDIFKLYGIEVDVI